VVCYSLFIVVVVVVVKPLQLMLEAREGELLLLSRKDNPLQLAVDAREESVSSLPRTRK
jgi:hypothetical protein